MPDRLLPAHVEVLVIGGGQAGLSISRHLVDTGVRHVVLERDRALHEWRDARWHSFSLVTPNWQCRLPGYPYTGDDPDGFMVKDEILAYLQGFRASFDPPLFEGVAVTGLRRDTWSGRFVVDTELWGSPGPQLTADQVVVATGAYQAPVIPGYAERLPARITQLHSATYRRPDDLPPGEVLVVGSGQSGTQIAEDLHLAGRRVHLAVGDAPRCARFYRGRDVVAWLADMGHYDLGIDTQPDPDATRAKTNHYVTGRDGGHDLDLRAFALEGMRLYGRLQGLLAQRLQFAGDLAAKLDAADAVYNDINASIDAYIAAHGIDAPPPSVYRPVWEPPDSPRELDLDTDGAGITSVVWAIGYRADYRWLHAPVFDGAGRPVHHRGVTDVPGLYFLGLPWLHTWGSGRLLGVGADAGYLAERIRGTQVLRDMGLAGLGGTAHPAANGVTNGVTNGAGRALVGLRQAG